MTEETQPAEQVDPQLLAQTLRAEQNAAMMADTFIPLDSHDNYPDELQAPAINDFKPIPRPNQENPDGPIKMTYYKHPMGSARYGFRSGGEATFVNHLYATSKQEEIDELDSEAHHIGLTKATGMVHAAELTNPELAFKNKIIREYLVKQRAGMLTATDPGRDLGEYVQPRGVGAANTRGAMPADVAMSMVATDAANVAAATGEPQTFAIPGAGNKPNMDAMLAKLRGK